MHSYCTIFDSYYLTKGLTMYRSLMRSGDPFKLYIFCFDDLTHEILRTMDLANVVLISLAEFETGVLKRVKIGRSRGEYCWTCTPHVIHYALSRYSLPQITYLDADIYFFSSPAVLLDEFKSSGGSVLITEHRYTERYDQSSTSGVYCVQFITFRRDQKGLEALNWWGAQCLEWCYARFEDGKFGDQKYLDDWLARFQGIYVLEHLGGGVAPWNVQQYEVGPGPLINGIPVVFYHFHYLTWHTNNSFNLGEYVLTRKVIKHIYVPYVAQLEDSLKQIQRIHPDFTIGITSPKSGFDEHLKNLKKRVVGAYNVIQR